MELENLGFTNWFKQKGFPPDSIGCVPARVTEVHRDSYTVLSEGGEVPAEPTGTFLFSTQSGADLPCVGDWVMARYYNDDTMALIHSLFPRKSFLRRKTSGKRIDYQMIAANIDTGFIVQGLDNDFSIRRLDRYLVMIREGGIEPVIILTKSDLLSSSELHDRTVLLRDSGIDCGTVLLSNKTGDGRSQVEEILKKGRTYCLVGSSGVGKTTLLNSLLGEEIFPTRSVRTADGKGRHTTTRRQLTLLGSGAMIIDTPGMRELGNIGTSEGIELSFSDIEDLAVGCRFSNCTHTGEKGCAVLAAIKNGELSEVRFESYRKIQDESSYHEMSFLEKRKRDKEFGKMCKTILEHHRKR